MLLTIKGLVARSHLLAVKKGWWPTGQDFSIPEKLALIHSEISEALEEVRNHNLEHEIRFSPNGKPEGFAIELADAVIRIADLCGKLGIDLENAIEVKHQYNETRPHRHGGKRF